MKRDKKMLNAKLKCHMAEPHAFLHEVFAFIYKVTNPCDAQESYYV